MSNFDPIAPYRQRAKGYVDAGLSDSEIDLKIIYIDADKRDVVWTFVHEYRAAKVARADTPLPGPGRPGWTAALFWQRYREAEAAAGEPKTPSRIAERFEQLDGTRGTMGANYLRQLRKRFERK